MMNIDFSENGPVFTVFSDIKGEPHDFEMEPEEHEDQEAAEAPEDPEPQPEIPALPFEIFEDSIRMFDSEAPPSLVVTACMGISQKKTIRCTFTGTQAKQILRVFHDSIPAKRLPQLQAVIETGAKIHEDLMHKKLAKALSNVDFEDPAVIDYLEKKIGNKKRKRDENL